MKRRATETMFKKATFCWMTILFILVTVFLANLLPAIAAGGWEGNGTVWCTDLGCTGNAGCKEGILFFLGCYLSLCQGGGSITCDPPPPEVQGEYWDYEIFPPPISLD